MIILMLFDVIPVVKKAVVKAVTKIEHYLLEKDLCAVNALNTISNILLDLTEVSGF